MRTEPQMAHRWSKVALADIATIERAALQPDQIKPGTIYVGLEHMDSNGRFVNPKRVDAGELASSKFQFSERHVLYGKLRPYLAKIACPDFSGICSTDIVPILPSDKIDRRFLLHFLRQPSMVGYATSRAVGVNLPRLSPTVLAEFEIPLPPLSEQQRIAELLDRADTVRSKRLASLAQLRAFTESLFFNMFGDVSTNNRQWPTERMGDLMRIRRGGSPRPIERYLGGEINWIKISDGTKGSDIYIDSCADKIISEGLGKTVFLRAGTLIFANCGVSLGFARILKVDGCIHDGWLALEDIPEGRLDKLFLLKALNSITDHFRRTAPAGTQPNLNTGLMKNFRIILPPIELQIEFARSVHTVEQLKEQCRLSMARLDSLFVSLQHRAFSGEL
jgi:type I restriction enzyme S subunit